MPSLDAKHVNSLVRHMVDIGRGRCTITDEEILAQDDENIVELLSGLVILHETIEYQKELVEESHRQLRLLVEDLNRTNHDLIERTEQLRMAQDSLVEQAHQAGMAEIATGVLHNIGNVLNSVNTSASHLNRLVRHSKLDRLDKTTALLNEYKTDLGNFFTQDPRGQRLLPYLTKLTASLGDERGDMLQQLERLTAGISTVMDILHAQQDYAKATIFSEWLSVASVVSAALDLERDHLANASIQIETKFETVPLVCAHKNKLMHIVVNLLKNAREAMLPLPVGARHLSVTLVPNADHVELNITDSGIGIEPSGLEKVFSHGYTTKTRGHGFGLHSCANHMTEMGGSIRVASAGPGKGATFTLVFPPPADPAETAG